MAELFQAISAGKAAIDGLKLLSQYADEVKDVSKRGEFMRIIGELSIELAETQVKLADRITENHELKTQVIDLQKKVEALENPDSTLIIRDGVYYTPENDGPFCTGCYDNNKKKIRLSKLPPSMTVLGKYNCPICGAKYGYDPN